MPVLNTQLVTGTASSSKKNAETKIQVIERTKLNTLLMSSINAPIPTKHATLSRAEGRPGSTSTVGISKKMPLPASDSGAWPAASIATRANKMPVSVMNVRPFKKSIYCSSLINLRIMTLIVH